jgi:hypothetical protein
MRWGSAAWENCGMVSVNSGWNPGYGGGAPTRQGRLQPGCVLLKPFTWAATLVMVVGIGIALVGAPWDGLWKMVRGSADAVGDVEPEGSERIELGESGEWILYAEGDVTVDDCGEDICQGDFVIPEIEVVDEGGDVLDLAPSSLSVSDAGTESVSLYSFDVAEAQTVEISVSASDIDRIAVAKSPELELGSFSTSLVGLAVLGVGIVLRMILGAVGSLFRS